MRRWWLDRLIARLLASTTWARTRRLVRRHRLLLGDDTGRLLTRMADHAQQVGATEDVATYRFHLELLHRCRMIGVDAAIAEQVGIAELWDRGVAALHRHRDAEADDGPPTPAATSALSEAVTLLDMVVARTYLWDPARPEALINLGQALVDRYDRDGRPADLDRAVSVLDEALGAMTLTSPAARSAALAELGRALLAGRGLDAGSTRLHRAVDALRLATPLAGDDVDRGRRLTNLGIALSERFLRDGDASDLDDAVDAYEQAYASPVATPDEHASRMAHLSTGLAERSTRRGTPEDLDRAVALGTQAVATASPGSPDVDDWIENLALLLRDRFLRDGDLTDLDEALDRLQRLVDSPRHTTTRRPATPHSRAARAGRLDQLATTLRLRALHHDNPDDLARAVALHREAAGLATRPEQRCTTANNLGGSLRLWGTSTDDAGALDEAVAAYREALTLVASPGEAAAVSSNLGAALLDRYDLLGATADLDEAVAVLTAAVTATPPEASDRAARCNNQANALRRRYERDGDVADADAATAAYLAGSDPSRVAPVEVQLRCALNLGRWTMRDGYWVSANRAFDAARVAADRLVTRQVTRRHKQAWLADVTDVAAAAALARSATRDHRASVVWLEWGRARALSDALDRERRDLAALAAHDDTLAARYRRAVARVRALELA